MALNDGLVDVPNIPLPIGDFESKETVTDLCDSAFKWAFIGAGQAGARIAEAFWKIGYRRVCCVNTTSQDMAGIDIPEENKLVMDMGEGGAGKNPENGEKAAKKYYEDVYDLMRRSFGKDFDRVIVCAGAGGGTGGGSCETIIDIAHDICVSLRKEGPGMPPAVGAVVSMPMVSEGQKVNANAHKLLSSLFGRVGKDSGKISGRSLSPLAIIDNERIKKIYPGLSSSQFWKTANQSIASHFYLFNNIATAQGDIWTFDKADLKTVLDSGVVTFGACPLQKWDEATDISYAIRDNLRKTILVGDLEISQSQVAACIFIGNPDVLDSIPQDHLEHGFEMIGRIMSDKSTVHRGLYKGNKQGLVVYTILGELGAPTARLEEIARIGGVGGTNQKY
jgi:cell division GTPase FtsZ